jgi:hypothetical protein
MERNFVKKFVEMSDKECDAFCKIREIIKERDVNVSVCGIDIDRTKLLNDEFFESLKKLRIIVKAINEQNAYIRGARVKADGHIYYRIVDRPLLQYEMELSVYGDCHYLDDEYEGYDVPDELFEKFVDLANKQLIYYEQVDRLTQEDKK